MLVENRLYHPCGEGRAGVTIEDSDAVLMRFSIVPDATGHASGISPAAGQTHGEKTAHKPHTNR